MKKLSLLIIALTLFLLFTIHSCSNRISPEDGSDRSGISSLPGGRGGLRDNPLGERRNPLQTYIRENWTDEDEESTAGLHRDHIKVYSGAHGWTSSDGDQAEFAVSNFDMFVGGGVIVEDYIVSPYETFIWLSWVSGAPFIGDGWDSIQTAYWIDSDDNEDEYTWEDLIMHLKFDYCIKEYCEFIDTIPGWNPADDQNQDGCIDDPGNPSDPNRTAECIWNAEMRRYIPPPKDKMWWYIRLNPDDAKFAGVLDMRSDLHYNAFIDHDAHKGAFQDEAAWNTTYDYGLQNTFTYGGNEPSSEYSTVNSQYYHDRIHYIPHFTYEFEEKLGYETIVVANTCSPTHTCLTSSPHNAKEWMQAYLENLQDEYWLQINCGSGALTKNKRDDWLDCPFLDYLEDGKGYIFCSYEGVTSPPDDRGKLFSLATFYMINHQMAFYGYRRKASTGEKIDEYAWNPYVDYDVGQPDVNSLDLDDFQGNPDTDRFFVWEDDTDYEILGREYLRDDDKRVLVLTKIMAQGKTEGASETSHCLPNYYRIVSYDYNTEDFVFSSRIGHISLVNNEGIILVEEPDSTIQFTDIQWSEDALNCRLTVSWETPDIECQGRAYLYTYSGSNCATFLNYGIDGQYSESHSVTFDVDPGQYYGVKLFVKTMCSDWIAEDVCHSHRMGRCMQ